MTVKHKHEYLTKSLEILDYSTYAMNYVREDGMLSRNVRGVDIVIYSQDGAKKHTIQAKSLSRRSAVPFGNNPNSLFADYLIICRISTNPQLFIISTNKIKTGIHKREKDGCVSYWLSPIRYEIYKDNWNEIGQGF